MAKPAPPRAADPEPTKPRGWMSALGAWRCLMVTASTRKSSHLRTVRPTAPRGANSASPREHARSHTVRHQNLASKGTISRAKTCGKRRSKEASVKPQGALRPLSTTTVTASTTKHRTTARPWETSPPPTTPSSTSGPWRTLTKKMSERWRCGPLERRPKSAEPPGTTTRGPAID